MLTDVEIKRMMKTVVVMMSAIDDCDADDDRVGTRVLNTQTKMEREKHLEMLTWSGSM